MLTKNLIKNFLIQPFFKKIVITVVSPFCFSIINSCFQLKLLAQRSFPNFRGLPLNKLRYFLRECFRLKFKVYPTLENFFFFKISKIPIDFFFFKVLCNKKIILIFKTWFCRGEPELRNDLLDIRFFFQFPSKIASGKIGNKFLFISQTN